MTILLAFYKGTRAENPAAKFFDRLVCWWWPTRGRFSHVELIGGSLNGRCWCHSSSIPDGVRSKWINVLSGRWVIVAVPGFIQHGAAVWFTQHEGARYDYAGILGFALPFFKQRSRRFYCSEAVALAMQAIAKGSAPDVPLPWPPAQISPNGLFAWCVTQPGAQIFLDRPTELSHA